MDHPEVIVQDGSDQSGSSAESLPTAVVPLILHERAIGALQVTVADPARVWNENEIMLLRTVADQVAVAVNHAELFAKIQQQALTDALTGCYNRRSFEIQLDKDVQMARRLNQPLSLLMLDLDRFKQLNDSVGHDAGDDALRRLTACFRQELRGVDSAARFGGDEFALILPQASVEGALIVAERLRARIEQIEIPGYGNITASIGIATFPSQASARAELVSAADAALYSAKRTGRNRVCVFDTTSDARELIRSQRNPPADIAEHTM
jgi:diguanylate cyclase (GGDEF)-like protein